MMMMMMWAGETYADIAPANSLVLMIGDLMFNDANVGHRTARDTIMDAGIYIILDENCDEGWSAMAWCIFPAIRMKGR